MSLKEKLLGRQVRHSDSATRTVDGCAPVGTARRRRLARWVPLIGLALVPLTLLSATEASAAEIRCMVDRGPYQMDPSSRAWETQHANNTWDDWIWRGPQFKCPTNVPSCTYAWNNSQTTTYAVAVMGLAGLQGDPAKLLGQLLPSFTYSKTWTVSYTFTVTLLPGQIAQPIQVVVRRWRAGQLTNYWGRFPSYDYQCKGDARNPGRVMYQFRTNQIQWTANKEEDRFATYNVHR